ncbi:MAG: glycosyltransferase family 2 protein [Candidatus Vogelbacteria bacterium]|nr:glycosyltransferase family 2 protein [Candidatus Vogelbacteria bacterium]
MNIPKISLIIPAYNEEKYLGFTLDRSIKNSHGKLYEIIVVDNTSTDDTAGIALLREGVRVVREEHKGITWARQRGFMEAKGEILAYNDADSYMSEDWVETVIEEFSRDKNLASLSGPYIYYNSPKWQQWIVRYIWWNILALPSYWIVGYMIIGGNFAIRKSVLEKMGGFDTSIAFYGEDTNIARRASKFGKSKFKVPFIVYSSNRRLEGQGLVNTGFLYIINFLSEVILHRPFNKEYKDIR